MQLTCACCGKVFDGWQHYERDTGFGICIGCCKDYGYHTEGKKPKQPDLDAARELHLYIANDGELYHQRQVRIENNLFKKWNKGDYDISKACRAYSYLVTDGAKKYCKEFVSADVKYHQMFDKATRDYVASQFEELARQRWCINEGSDEC